MLPRASIIWLLKLCFLIFSKLLGRIVLFFCAALRLRTTVVHSVSWKTESMLWLCFALLLLPALAQPLSPSAPLSLSLVFYKHQKCINWQTTTSWTTRAQQQWLQKFKIQAALESGQRTLIEMDRASGLQPQQPLGQQKVHGQWAGHVPEVCGKRAQGLSADRGSTRRHNSQIRLRISYAM